MKLFTIALTALALCGAALAGPAEIINAHFSTPIFIGDKALPAGDITFNLLRGSNSTILTARTQDGKVAAVMVSRIQDAGDATGTSVVLTRRGNDLKFERIQLDNGTTFAVSPDAQ
jgi:hypothetical protein